MSRSIYEYMGNKKWLATAEQERGHGQTVMPGMEQPSAIGDLDERYTTRETLIWCAAKAGVTRFTMDVAACAEAHVADEWYHKDFSGLDAPWHGDVWCNPPYSNIGPWVSMAWDEHQRRGGPRRIAMLLPATRTEQPWWQEDVEPWRDENHVFTTHFLPGRVKFGHPGNPEGKGVGSPPFGCVLLVWRRA